MIFTPNQRYYSAILDVYADITTNFSRLNTENKLAFVIFSCLQSNGTLAICEVCRHLLSNIDVYRYELDNECNGCFWTLLIKVGKETSFKSVGTCTTPRFTHFNKGSIFQFEKYGDYILDQFQLLNDEQSYEEMHLAFERVQENIEKKVFGIGDITSLPFLQVCSLIGLLPLRVATFATVKIGGPANFLTLGNSHVSAPTVFKTMHKEFSDLWGPQVTEAYLENSSCEHFRTISRRCMKKEKSLLCLFKESPLFSAERGIKKDVVPLYAHRGLTNCIMSLFYLNVDDKGCVELHMRGLKLNLESRIVEGSEPIALRSFDDASIHHYYTYK